MVYGLPQQSIDGIREVFEGCEKIEKAWLYGSRALGNFKPGSDIDLTLIGDSLTLTDLLHLENELDDLLLPYKIDLSLFQFIDNPDLIDHIRQVGVVFYDRQVPEA